MRSIICGFVLLLAASPAAAALRPDVAYRDAALRAARAEACSSAALAPRRAPHRALTGLLRVLRTERREADGGLGGLERFPVGQRVYTSHVRLARTFDGARFFVVPFQRMSGILRPQRARCRRHLLGNVRRLEPSAVPYARRRLARARRISALAPDAVTVVVADDRVVGQGVTARRLGLEGEWGSTGENGERSRVHMLLPDAVGRVRSHHNGFVADVTVHDNMAIFYVPAVRDSEPQLVEWFDRAGNLIRRIPRGETSGD